MAGPPRPTALLGLLLLGLAALAQELQFEPIKYKVCKSAFEVVSVEAVNCPQDEKKRCLFRHGTSATLRIGFKPDRQVTHLQAKVRAKLSNSYVNFHLENEDACQGQNLTCPLLPGQLYYYSQQVRIAREYPTVDVLVNWMLNDPATADDKAYADADGTRVKNDVCVVFQARVLEQQS